MDPRHSRPTGGGWTKSDVGHRKYVLVTDIALRSRLTFRASLQALKMTNFQVICDS